MGARMLGDENPAGARRHSTRLGHRSLPQVPKIRELPLGSQGGSAKAQEPGPHYPAAEAALSPKQPGPHCSAAQAAQAE